MSRAATRIETTRTAADEHAAPERRPEAIVQRWGGQRSSVARGVKGPGDGRPLPPHRPPQPSPSAWANNARLNRQSSLPLHHRQHNMRGERGAVEDRVVGGDGAAVLAEG